MESTFGVESPSYVAIRALLSLCALGLVGALALRVAVLGRYAGPNAAALRRAIDAPLRKLLLGLGMIAAFATIARLGAQHAAVFGTDIPIDRASLTTLLVRASWGRTWWLACVSVTLLCAVALRFQRESSTRWVVATLAIGGFVASQPWSGHPAAAAKPALAIATQCVHLVAAGAWLGSLALLITVAIPVARRLPTDGADTPELRIALLVRAFSPVALGCASLLALTGAATAWSHLGTFTALFGSQYGRVLLLKLLAVALVAGIGAFNWRRVAPRLGESAAAGTLQRSAIAELVAATAVVVITAVLTATPMPGE